MKKFFKTIFVMSFILLGILVGKSNAAALDAIQINTNKEIVNPGSEIVLNINFGKPLGAYTFDINYDNNLLEFVSTDGGTENDNGTRVRIVYYDSSGGSNPKESMNVTFKAKEEIQTSNPTDFSITAEGLSNPDASESYDDITVPIKKSITVEPQYEDYKFELTYSGNPIINEEKEMTLTLSSAMGRFYDHSRILAEATTPNNGNVQLLGTDENQLEHDLIDSGWGDVSGDKIGGNVTKTLNLRGIFDTAGQYTITFKLIDRDNSDSVIAENSFTINVEEKQIIPPTEENPPTEIPSENNPNNVAEGQVQGNNTENDLPKELPKTGYNYYAIFGITILVIGLAVYILRRKSK